MFATRHRRRSRRPSRFVPTVDGLQARIAPASFIPVEGGMAETTDDTTTEPPVTSGEMSGDANTAGTDAEVVSGETYEDIMIGVFNHLEECLSGSPTEV